MNKNTVLFGKDQVNFQVSKILFGVQKEFLQKYRSKELSEIAGSSHQLPQLLKFHLELKIFSLTQNIQVMELSKFISTSEEKELALMLMIESQLSTLDMITLLHILQLTPNHQLMELGG